MKKRKSITYNNILNLWLNTKNDIKIKSLLNYENLINSHIVRTIGNLKINKMKKEDIELFFDNLKENKVATSTIKNLMYIIRSSLTFAYNKKYCNYIDLSNIRIKTSKINLSILSKEEQNKLETKLKSKVNIRKVCLLLCLYTGIRIGEVCGLKWEDIDFSNKSLRVKRTIERIKNKDSELKSKTLLIESTPKSSSSYRIIPIPNFLIKYLFCYKNDGNYYLLSNSQKLYDPRLLESFYARILKSCNINHNKFHTLRHTFATRSIESKMDIKTLSEILGHSSIEVTLKLYIHPTYEMKRESLENLVKFMTN